MSRSRGGRQTREAVRFLPVHVGEVCDVPAWSQWTVICPRRGRIGLEHCIECPHFGSLRVATGGRTTLATCRFEAPHVEAAREAAKLAPLTGSTPAVQALSREQLRLSAELGVGGVATLLAAKSLWFAAVVDRDTRPLGVVSQQELTQSFRGPRNARKRVREAMRPLLTLGLDSTVADVADTMCEKGVDCVALVTNDGRLEGLLTALELLPHVITRAAARLPNRPPVAINPARLPGAGPRYNNLRRIP